MKLSRILIYPLKSSKGISLNTTNVHAEGLNNDREYAVINKNGEVLTGREFPKLLGLKTQILNGKLIFQDNLTLLESKEEIENYKATIFGEAIEIQKLNKSYSEWISNYLDHESHIVKLNAESRTVGEKYGVSKDINFVNLSDISPIHLITQASLDDLNSKLSKGDQVSIHTFRPNLVIENEEAFEEDNWKTVQIGNVVFNVHYKATRCSMLQINPITLKNNLNSEPLRTLSKYRRNDKGKVCFGVYLIPRNSGEVHLGDSIIVLK